MKSTIFENEFDADGLSAIPLNPSNAES